MSLIVSKATQCVVVPPNPGVLSMFGDAPRLPDGNVVIKHDMRTHLMLKHLGFEPPNPMLLYYDWRGGTPFAVQRATCKLLTENRRAYVLNDMGTGKTKTALWAWDFMNRAGLCKKLLVVCPLSTVEFVWGKEVFATLPGRNVQCLVGSKQDRLDKLAVDADIYVINHDGLRVIASELHARADIDTLVLDELAVYRNNSDRSKRMRKFAKRFNLVWGLTGAPMPNEPTDVWAQCRIITPHTVPEYYSRAREMLMSRVTTYKWRPKPDAVANAFAMMQPSVRYSLDDVVELPQLVVPTPTMVPLSAQQKSTYERVCKDMRAMIADKAITAVNAGAAMNKLLQIAGGWVYTNNPEYVRIDAAERIVTTIDLVQSAARKVLIAIPYRHMIEGISKIFAMSSVNIEHCIVHGDTKNREQIFNLFQNTDKYKAMLVHPRCVAHGVTLTAADTLIWYLPVTSLEIYDQFNARFRRVGQQHKQQLYRLQSTPVEKRIYKMLAEHQKMQDGFLRMVEEASGDF